MFKEKWFLMRSLFYVAILTVLSGCDKGLEGKPVDLEPNDPRPVLSIQVDDPDETALLADKLGLEILRVDGPYVYFFETPELLPRLRELGYDPRKQNPYNIFRRVVRIDRKLPEKELISSGIQIINREKDYLVIEASIGQLRMLEKAGSKIVAISDGEPRPRQVRIVVDSMEDVARIGAMEVDIYSYSAMHANEKKQKTAKAEIVIYGAAFDYQIDQIKAMDYSIEVMSKKNNK